jgi:hypothetical protein
MPVVTYFRDTKKNAKMGVEKEELPIASEPALGKYTF